MGDRIEYHHSILDLQPSSARRGVFSHGVGVLILTPYMIT